MTPKELTCYQTIKSFMWQKCQKRNYKTVVWIRKKQYLILISPNSIRTERFNEKTNTLGQFVLFQFRIENKLFLNFLKNQIKKFFWDLLYERWRSLYLLNTNAAERDYLTEEWLQWLPIYQINITKLQNHLFI